MEVNGLSFVVFNGQNNEPKFPVFYRINHELSSRKTRNCGHIDGDVRQPPGNIEDPIMISSNVIKRTYDFVLCFKIIFMYHFVLFDFT
jgi:hypothetical protein